MGLFRRYPVFISLLLFFLCLQIISFRLEQGPQDGVFHRAFLMLNYYPQRALSALSGGIVGLWDRYVYLVDLKRENEVLKEELKTLRSEMLSMEEARLENERLKELLSFKERVSFESLSARVIGASPSAARSELLIIDRGTEDGVVEGMPVATPEGAVGRVFASGYGSSEVVLVTDGISAVDAYVQSSRRRGIVKGTGGGLVMEYLSESKGIALGDRVISSGKDGFYPRGVVIGTVSDIERTRGGVRARISPAVDLKSLEEVLVILRPAGLVVEQ